ncbi:ATP-binding protein, partial [Cellulomonas bogoriensis 69B4 = DSM 16987]
IDAIRNSVDTGQVGMITVYSSYTNAAASIVEYPRLVADALGDRQLAVVVDTQTDVTELYEAFRAEQVLGREVLAGAREAPERRALGDALARTEALQFDTSVTVFRLDDETLNLEPALLATAGFESYANLRSLVGNLTDAFLNAVDPDQWYEAAEFELVGGEGEEGIADIESRVGQMAADRASVAAGAATREAAIIIAAALAAVAVSVVVALAIARAIVQPVRRLTVAAAKVRDELPLLVEQVSVPGQGPDLTLTKIPVTSRDEVGALAAAFNEVNETTIEVAQEQAALRASIAETFVNVARRDQVLLNRQLSFIDALERSEEDPTTLADLFRLDHLATRMRRNAESLLVLAGIDTGRRLRDPLATSDVIRTASSEIEHYERVQLDLPVDPLMLGHTALPAAHLLAELLENATVFSEPGTPVHVSTGFDNTHVLITILDQGLGMTPQEIMEANERLKKTSASDTLGAQRLGLYVVGRIADRLGAQVELAQGPSGTGTLAIVRLPRILFVDPSQIPLVQPNLAPSSQIESFPRPEQVAGALPPAPQQAPMPQQAPPQQAPMPQAPPQRTPMPQRQPMAPAPAGFQDVAPGSVGSVENPATEVDLGALTDGTTGGGLPRRRSRTADAAAPAPSQQQYREQDDAAAVSSIPLAPQADALAGAALDSDEVWTPPVVVPSEPLSVRREPAAADEAPQQEQGLPTRAPSAGGSGLPTRAPAGNLPRRESSQPAAGGLPV